MTKYDEIRAACRRLSEGAHKAQPEILDDFLRSHWAQLTCALLVQGVISDGDLAEHITDEMDADAVAQVEAGDLRFMRGVSFEVGP